MTNFFLLDPFYRFFSAKKEKKTRKPLSSWQLAKFWKFKASNIFLNRTKYSLSRKEYFNTLHYNLTCYSDVPLWVSNWLLTTKSNLVKCMISRTFTIRKVARRRKQTDVITIEQIPRWVLTNVSDRPIACAAEKTPCSFASHCHSNRQTHLWIRTTGCPPPSPLPLHVAKTGRTHLNKEITSLLPTGIGERYCQTISNLNLDMQRSFAELPL